MDKTSKICGWKWAQTKENKKYFHDLAYMWKQENKKTHRISEQTGGCQSQGVGVGK